MLVLVSEPEPPMAPTMSLPGPPPVLAATSNVDVPPLKVAEEKARLYGDVVVSLLVTESLLAPMLRLFIVALSEALISILESVVRETEFE